MASLHNQRRLQDLKTLLDEQYDKLAFFELEPGRTASPAQKFELTKNIADIKAKIRSYEEEHAELKAVGISPSPKQHAERKPMDRNQIIATLNRITPNQLSQIIFTVGMPQAEQPGSAAQHGDRVFALLQWAKSMNGCGLERIAKELEAITNPQ